MSQNGVVNVASYQTAVAPGAIVSVFGQNLAANATASSTPLPTVLGGSCVTLDDTPLPLFATAGTQINVQLPPDLKAGKHSLVVRYIDKNQASSTFSLTVAKYAPAVFVNAQTGQATVYHADGSPVSSSNKASRDEPLVLYATGLGATTGGAVKSGNPAPGSPLAVTDKGQVFFGDPAMKQSEVIVDWSGLVPGLVGVYQLNLRVPGFHTSGDTLPVMLRIGSVDSPKTGPVVPVLSVN